MLMKFQRIMKLRACEKGNFDPVSTQNKQRDGEGPEEGLSCYSAASPLFCWEAFSHLILLGVRLN